MSDSIAFEAHLNVTMQQQSTGTAPSKSPQPKNATPNIKGKKTYYNSEFFG
jgi:hypothetical protein